MSDSSACPQCATTLQPGTEFCEECGADVSGSRAADDLAAITNSPAVQTARKWLAGLAILFTLFGTGAGFLAQSQADDALSQLATVSPDRELTLEGETKTVAQWKTAVEQEVYLVFGMNYFLAAVMLGLFFWARKAPFPAVVTGLSVYLAVIALNAVLDPSTLAQGLIIKFFFIAAMVSAIKAILAERDAQEYEPTAT